MDRNDTFSRFMLDFYNNISSVGYSPDIIYKVEGVKFPAHRFIVASNCERLGLLPVSETTRIVEIDGIRPVIFGQLLKFLYCGRCELMEEGECKIKLPSTPPLRFTTPRFKLPNGTMRKLGYEREIDYSHRPVTPLELFRKLAYDLNVSSLKQFFSSIQTHMWSSYYIKNRYMFKDPVFNPKRYEHLLDFSLRANGGQDIHIHRCMLITHEYFRAALKPCWNKNDSKVLQVGMSIQMLKRFVDYLYTGTIVSDECWLLDDINFWLRMLILSDFYMVFRLKRLCESNLCNHLWDSKLNVKDTLDLALYYNATILESQCIQKMRIV